MVLFGQLKSGQRLASEFGKLIADNGQGLHAVEWSK